MGCEHTLSGSLKVPKERLQAYPWCKFDRSIEVNVMCLDNFAKLWSIGKMDFIWCDVQGAEDKVVAGAQNILRQTRYFYTEFYNNEMYEGQLPLMEILNRLPGGAAQWEIAALWPNDALFRFRITLGTRPPAPDRPAGSGSMEIRKLNALR
jgi:hypothetical protein